MIPFINYRCSVGAEEELEGRVDSAWNPMLLEPWAWMAKQVEIRQVGPEETQIAI